MAVGSPLAYVSPIRPMADRPISTASLSAQLPRSPQPPFHLSPGRPSPRTRSPSHHSALQEPPERRKAGGPVARARVRRRSHGAFLVLRPPPPLLGVPAPPLLRPAAAAASGTRERDGADGRRRGGPRQDVQPARRPAPGVVRGAAPDQAARPQGRRAAPPPPPPPPPGRARGAAAPAGPRRGRHALRRLQAARPHGPQPAAQLRTAGDDGGASSCFLGRITGRRPGSSARIDRPLLFLLSAAAHPSTARPERTYNGGTIDARGQ
ncbi:atherin-like [Triticum dicoccoides]|uniref:atherin-like n=1 Tax=Triticum dicoccoides TaxID=85692 RepID=UPI00188FFE16|nr:atherin-like [Triticum dicoccoides]